MKKLFPTLALLVALLALPRAWAADPGPEPDPAAQVAKLRQLAAGLKPQQGEIVLKGGIAKAKLPANLRYLDPADTETVLTKIWGNPKGDTSLGMLVPARFDPLASSSWAVILTFEEDGYVKDDDAAKIDYTQLLTKMKEGVSASNQERVKAGYPAIELIGWAAPPRYDSAAKKLYWAKELKFADSPEHTLNYCIRVLGRRGVLELNVVASMQQLKLIESAAPGILAAVDFQEGNRYADFKEGSDKVATYGIAALVAGGIAAKAGFFKLLWIGILALKKFIIIGAIALAGSIKKLWNWIRGRDQKATATVAPTPNQPPPTA